MQLARCELAAVELALCRLQPRGRPRLNRPAAPSLLIQSVKRSAVCLAKDVRSVPAPQYATTARLRDILPDIEGG